VSKFLNHWRGAITRAKSKSAASAPERTATAVRSCCDDEELAAFLDGRLDEPQRSEVMSELADGGDAYEVFACAAILRADGDALLERMQTAEVRAAARRAFYASPEDLRKAAVEAARGSER
jgi:hypothetical protein